MKLLRKYMPGFLTAFFILFTLVPAAFPALLDVGPTVPEVQNSTPPQHGYPLWYRDGKRVPLEICLSSAPSTVAGSNMCNLLPGPTFNPALPVSYPGNFPDEAFWWAGEAQVKIPNFIRATLVMAVEGAWSTGIITPGDQITFARIRFVVDAPVAGTYTITHPYGKKTFFNVPTGVHAIFDTVDIGVEAGKFTGALQGGVGPFLTWDSGIPINVGGESFIGDPNVPHTITGSPVGTNYFRVDGPVGSNLDGLGNSFVQTNLFAITGKIHTPPIPTPVKADRATYARDANGMQLSVFTTTNPISNATTPGAFPANFALTGTPSQLQVSELVIPLTTLATNTTQDGKFFAVTGSFADPGTIPATVRVTNIADVPQSITDIVLTDEIAISKATYNRSNNLLTIAASSSDRVAPPVLQAFMPGMAAPLGNLVNGQLAVTFPFTDNTILPAKTYIAPPEKITVKSAAGGSLTTDVDAFLPLAPAVMTSPANASILAGASQTFTWSNVGATSYQLWVGTAPGKFDIGVFLPGTATTTTATGLPVNGSTIYVRLYTSFGTTWVFNDYTYTASLTPAALISPANASTLAGASQTFTWNNVGATSYQLWVGTAPGKSNLAVYNPGTATTTNATGLPVNGSTIYVRLASLFGTTWVFNDYTYTAALIPAAMISPVNASVLTGASQTFTWSNSGAASYQLWVGTAPGKTNIGVFRPGTATTTNVTGLPTNGSTIYVRLASLFGTTWVFNDYTYTAALIPASLISPANASTLAGASQTFTWNNAGAASYQLWVGTAPGKTNLGVFRPGTATTTNVTGLPANGSTVYVRLASKFGTAWVFTDYSYTSGP